MQKRYFQFFLVIVCLSLAVLFTACGFPELSLLENALKKHSTVSTIDSLNKSEKVKPVQFEAPRGLSTAQGMLEKKLYFAQHSEGLAYFFPNGDTFWQQRAFDDEKAPSWIIPSASCRIRYYAEDQKEWLLLEEPKSFESAEMVFISFDGLELIVSPPFAYKAIENSCLQELPALQGYVYLEELEDGKWEFGLGWPQTEMGEAGERHWWVLSSKSQLIDWENPVMEEIWPGYQFTGSMRWCWNGMYQQTPDTYTPGGEGIFFLNPASYIPRSFVLTGGSRAADDLAMAMLDIIQQNYTAQGYIPVTTSSSWLEGEYGIGAGYFDTRWNTDLAEAYLLAGEKFGVREFTHTALNYADFLCRHISESCFRLPGMDLGILVSDYSWRGESAASHCSLNHQLAEALFLYHTAVPYYVDVADRLILGIEELGQAWLKENGDLQYGIKPDGSYIGQDYPDLTYNDLYKIQTHFENQGAGKSKVLNKLMCSKADWMENQGIPLRY